METKKETVTAWFPGGIGKIEISTKRAEQIKRLQRIIRERDETNTSKQQKSTLK